MVNEKRMFIGMCGINEEIKLWYKEKANLQKCSNSGQLAFKIRYSLKDPLQITSSIFFLKDGIKIYTQEKMYAQFYD